MTVEPHDIHPWNLAAWKRLAGSIERLPHGVLVTGAAGVGKQALVTRLARRRLCTTPVSLEPCGECRGCRWFDAASHPDMHVVSTERLAEEEQSVLARFALRYPAEPGRKERKDRKLRVTIGIDPIRALIDSVSTMSHTGGHKVVVIRPADAMTLNAANSFLKLLEEPPTGTLLLLVASEPFRLPATVRSRCIRIALHPPPAAEALDWVSGLVADADEARRLLDVSGGVPGAAVERAESGYLAARDAWLDDLEALLLGTGDPVGAARRWRETGTGAALAWLQGALADLIRLEAAANPPALFNEDARGRLRTLKDRINLKQLMQIFDAVGLLRGRLDGSLDESLLLEDALIRIFPKETRAT